MYFYEQNIKNLIISYVKDGEKSISRLARDLEKDGYKLHRLYLTGYLKAMADLGIMKEKEIPPAKVYTTSSNPEKNIYESIGERCASMELDEKEKTRIVAFILQRLFKRPIFFYELKLCGMDGVVVGSQIKPEERDEIRAKLLSAGLKIPKSDPAYIIEDDYESHFNDVILGILIEKFEVNQLVQDTKQTKLDEIGNRSKSKGKK